MNLNIYHTVDIYIPTARVENVKLYSTKSLVNNKNMCESTFFETNIKKLFSV